MIGVVSRPVWLERGDQGEGHYQMTSGGQGEGHREGRALGANVRFFLAHLC